MSESRRAKKRRAIHMRIAIAVVVLVAAVVGAYFFKQKSAVDVDVLMARAEQHYQARDFQAAIIDLKTVVSEQPNNRDARHRLGEIYLKAGGPKSALKEFERARELGLTDPAVGIGIAKALLLSGKFDEAATEIAINGDTSKPDWLVLQGMLDLGQQRIDNARATFSQILTQHPDHEEARRGLMRAELAAGNADLARKEIDTLLKSAAQDAGLWMLKGELDLYDKNPAAARDSFARALEIEADNPLAHIGAARAALELDDIDGAANQLDAIGVGGEEDPRVNFIRAQIAEKREDYSSALHALRKVVQVAPMHGESLVMAAKLHFSRGEYTRAQDYVSRILEIEPGNVAAQRMLGAIQLAAGRMDGLDDIVSKGVDASNVQDPGMLALLGTAYLRHGRHADSQASLERAAELAPDSLPIRTQLAMSRLTAGDPDKAIAELQAILAEDPDFTQAEIMLVLVYLSQGEMDTATAAGKALVDKKPDSALAHNVYGYVLELAGDKPAAIKEFETALEHDRAFHPARINLARLAVIAKDTELGRKHFQDVLAIEPFHAMALMGLAALALQADDLDEAERLWLLARDNNPDAVAPRLLLSKHYRAKRNLTLATTMIKEAYQLAPYAPQVQSEYAVIMLETQSYDEALKAARLLVERSPDSLVGLELLARAQNLMGDAEGLTATLEKIAQVAPDAAPTRVLLGRLAIRRKDYAQATTIAKALLADPQHAALGHELAGDARLAQDDAKGARAAYLAAFEVGPATSNVLKLDQVERQLGENNDRLGQWLIEHPDDLQVRLTRASILHMEGSGSRAIPEYEQLLAAEGNNPIVLNNLAWLYHEAGDERALELARRAYELAPGSAEIMDTYGWILFNSGKQEQGIGMLGKAEAAAPENPDIAFHVASALHSAGDSKAAREKLKNALEKHAEFALRGEAEALFNSLPEPD